MRNAIALTGLLAAALAAACCSDAPTAEPGPEGTCAPAPELGVPHAFRIAEGVYRGSQPEKGHLKGLRDAGIRTLVSFRTSKPMRAEAEALGISVVEIPIEAALESDPPTPEQVKLFFDTVLDPAKQPVYFHCLHGRDRTGTMAAIYRIEVDGWTSEKAIAEMKQLGFHEWYRDLEKFVREYRPRGFWPPAR